MVEANGTILLDGGTGRELKRRGVEVTTGLWSAKALMDAPEVVVAVHRDFIDAGADVIITNNYAVVPNMLATAGVAHRLEELTRLSGALARRGREQARRPARIAGSLPPLVSSYRPDLVGTNEDMAPVYAGIVEALAPAVDLFICETMSSAREARAAAEAAAASGRPVWVSWNLADDGTGLLRSGETAAQAHAALDGIAVEAFLFNCCAPESISLALPALRATTEAPIGAYANAFQSIPKDYKQASSALNPLRGDLDPEQYAVFAADWLAAGAHIVGGCCGIGPEHIARLRALIRATD